MAGSSEHGPRGNGRKTVQLSGLAQALGFPDIQVPQPTDIAGVKTPFSDMSVADKFVYCAGGFERNEDQATRLWNLSESFASALEVPKLQRNVRLVVYAPWNERRQMTTGDSDLVGNAVCAFYPDPDMGLRSTITYDRDLMQLEGLSRSDIFSQADAVRPERPFDAYRRLRDNLGYINSKIVEQKRELELRRSGALGLLPRGRDTSHLMVVSDPLESLNHLKSIAVRNYLETTLQLEQRPLWRRGQLKPLFVVTDADDEHHVELYVWQLRDGNQHLRYDNQNAQEYLLNGGNYFSVGLNYDHIRSQAAHYVDDDRSPTHITAAHNLTDILQSREVRARRRDGRGGSELLDRLATAA